MEIADEKAIVQMYIENKFSATQIGDSLRTSPSKVRRILDKYKVSRRSISDAITQLNITKFKKIPFEPKHILSPREKELKITGIMLYWGEGAKTGSSLKLANSNPDMIKVFLLFLRKICGVDEDRIKILVHMYPDHERSSLENFWSSVTNIGLKNFYKPQILAGKKGTYKNKSVYGTATIHYSDKKLLKLVLRWIDEYRDDFLKTMPE